MTAIPDATPEDFKQVRLLRIFMEQGSYFEITRGMVASLGKVLSHYQRENERLARENDLWLRRFDWLRGTFKDEQIVDGKIIITLGGGQATQQDSMENFLNMWDQVMESDALAGEGGAG